MLYLCSLGHGELLIMFLTQDPETGYGTATISLCDPDSRVPQCGVSCEIPYAFVSLGIGGFCKAETTLPSEGRRQGNHDLQNRTKLGCKTRIS